MDRGYESVILFNLLENYINPVYPENMIFVDLKFGPKWKYISTVRTFVENFMAISLADKKKAGVIAMSVNELIENAIKYSDKESIQIAFQVLADENKIYVNVTNHARAEEEKRLQNLLSEINALPPLEAYMMRMKLSYESSDKKSSIGLARIRYESRAEITHTYDDDGFIHVHAAIPIYNDGAGDERN